MKAFESGVDAELRPELETDLGETVQALFGRMPRLQGFSVQDAAASLGNREAGRLEGDLCLADITVFPLDSAASDACFGEIAVALVDLIDERPEARELLRGRTFTRTRQ